jgi:hypothetical protein
VLHVTLDCIEKAAAYIEAKYQAKGGDATAFGGAKYATLDAAKRNEVFAAMLPMAPRPGVPAEALHRHRAGRREDPALRQLEGRRPPRRARHELPRPFPAHQDQAALRGLEPAGRGFCRPQEEAGRRPRAAYRKDYAAYYAKCKHANSPAMRDPNPTVVLIPGVGLVAWGKDKSPSPASRPSSTPCAVEVMRGAEAIDQYHRPAAAGGV